MSSFLRKTFGSVVVPALLTGALAVSTTYGQQQPKPGASSPIKEPARVAQVINGKAAVNDDDRPYKKSSGALAQDYSIENKAVALAITIGRKSGLYIDKGKGDAVADEVITLVSSKMDELNIPYKIFVDFNETAGIGGTAFSIGYVFKDPTSGEVILTMPQLARSLPAIKEFHAESLRHVAKKATAGNAVSSYPSPENQ
ncbi:MAG: hypothetical protein ACT4OY_08555 [Alphaproteobacteria bacterium]